MLAVDMWSHKYVFLLFCWIPTADRCAFVSTGFDHWSLMCVLCRWLQLLIYISMFLQEIEFLTSSISQLKVVQTKYVEAKDSLNVLNQNNKGEWTFNEPLFLRSYNKVTGMITKNIISSTVVLQLVWQIKLPGECAFSFKKKKGNLSNNNIKILSSEDLL